LILRDYFQQNKRLIDEALRKYLPPSDVYTPILNEAIRYSLFPGGKRLRPLLALAAYRTCGGKGKKILPFACALEMLHTSFLIHDDLPALDNDAYRRGRLTVHKRFGPALAILAGDSLFILAFSVMSKSKDPKLISSVIKEISNAVGTKGVLAGQAAEIESRLHRGQMRSDKQRLWKYIHIHKTAALIKVAVTVGAIVAGAEKRRIEALAKFGRNFGLSFQIADDILDNNGYAKILGRERAKRKAIILTRKAIKYLECFGRKADALREIANFCLNRR
jgi:geranylgeranyl diphosphate synthase type II